MAFTTGTATNWIDLADKLRLWLTGTAGWTQLSWTAGNVDTGGMELKLRGPGAGAGKQVFINIRSVHDDTVPQYGWEIRGAVDYVAAQPWGLQPGESNPCFLSLWKSTITYWFYANDRRFIVIAKCNTVYLSAYCGFVLPWATPEQYPFPLYVAASDGILRPYNSTNSAHSSMVDPGGPSSEAAGDFCGGKIRLPDGSWQRVFNRKVGSSTEEPWGHEAGNYPFVFPYSARFGFVSSTLNTAYTWLTRQTGGSSSQGAAAGSLVATAQGERLLFPVSVMAAADPGGYAALDGVYFPMGQGLSPEQTASYGARNFRMFPNIHRIACNHFFAVEEV